MFPFYIDRYLRRTLKPGLGCGVRCTSHCELHGKARIPAAGFGSLAHHVKPLLSPDGVLAQSSATLTFPLWPMTRWHAGFGIQETPRATFCFYKLFISYQFSIYGEVVKIMPRALAHPSLSTPTPASYVTMETCGTRSRHSSLLVTELQTFFGSHRVSFFLFQD